MTSAEFGIRPVLCLVGLLSGFAMSIGSVTADTTSRLDTLFGNAFDDDGPGAAVLVAVDGRTVLRNAYGLANLELQVPMRANLVFMIGSVTKQFTAAAILLLAEQEKLSVEDPITMYLPDYPTHGHQITIEQLLTHTSGIANYTSADLGIDKNPSTDELIAGFAKLPMDFGPGADFTYSNSGYILLGAIIEKVTGGSYQEFIAERFFGPLRMSQSRYGSSSAIVVNRASGYLRAPERYLNASLPDMVFLYSAGGIMSTVDDLKLWTEALFSGHIISQSSLDRMVSLRELSDGSISGSNASRRGYGMGFMLSQVDAHTVAHHGGEVPGFTSALYYVPGDRVFVCILTNALEIGPQPQRSLNSLAVEALHITLADRTP